MNVSNRRQLSGEARESSRLPWRGTRGKRPWWHPWGLSVIGYSAQRPGGGKISTAHNLTAFVDGIMRGFEFGGARR